MVRVLTSLAAGRCLGTSTKTIRRWISRGWLPATFTRGRYRMDRAAVALFLRWGPPLMPPGRAAKAANRDSSTVRRWLNQGRLAFVVVRGQRLIRRDDLRALLTPPHKTSSHIRHRGNADKTRARHDENTARKPQP
jgi:excisionase family DNA binding protein